MASVDDNEECFGFYVRDPKTKRKCVNWNLLYDEVLVDTRNDDWLFLFLSYLQVRLWLKRLKKWRHRR